VLHVIFGAVLGVTYHMRAAPATLAQ